ncbi:Phosphoheptose isomerase [Candidatus Defluviicoccus seviourii]|uniref:Phosphoheptose isomerase n=2 Tax=root TaxID=1 RepID=A0A564WCC6_9PROT|nr:Phosphoheptose isomerase [uncultured Defluviicoccus sp.]VUX45941.1 Phosphoheptose isomerase [Candidatus Defluviicoccus seviourii]
MRTVADLFAREMDEHLRLTEAVAAGQADAFAAAAGACVERLGTGGKLLLFGNGGSAADAQHLAAELTVRLVSDRRPIPALALTADTAVLTAAGNDLGFQQIFARQIEALGQAGDIALAISTSGRSPNVLEGLAAARPKGLLTIGFCGANPSDMAGLCDHLLAVPSAVTARVQELHIVLGHMLCSAIEQGLGLAPA